MDFVFIDWSIPNRPSLFHPLNHFNNLSLSNSSILSFLSNSDKNFPQFHRYKWFIICRHYSPFYHSTAAPSQTCSGQNVLWKLLYRGGVFLFLFLRYKETFILYFRYFSLTIKSNSMFWYCVKESVIFYMSIICELEV